MSEQQKPTLPGSKAKQAEALSQNIRWLVKTFGREHIGFLTLTVGDVVDGKFVKVTARAEASRRFNSLLTHIIRGRYQCGVVVTERHADGGIHFHLVVVLGRDIRGDIDFAACFPRREHGRPIYPPCYDTANDALKLEWKFWRERAGDYGFGRHNLQPVESTGEALGYYVAEYVSKSWKFRTEDDKGGRLVRNFGRWSIDGHNFKAPWYANHGSLKPWARAWRDCAKQATMLCALDGFNLTQDNIKRFNGRKWAWDFTRRFNEHEFFLRQPFDAALRETMIEHNTEAHEAWPGREIHVGHSRAEAWLRCEDWAQAEVENQRERLADKERWEARDAEQQTNAWLRESMADFGKDGSDLAGVNLGPV